MLSELNHMAMAVGDLTACKGLYGGALGLVEVHQTADTAWFQVGPTLVELRQEAGAGAGTAGEARPAINHFALHVDAIDAAYAALQHAGVSLLGPPQATSVGHRNMQRSLLAFEDPNRFHIQVSETIDPRPHLEGRKRAKQAMASAGDGGRFGGIDHIAMYCTDYAATRAFWVDGLGLDEFFHSATREAGTEVAPGFEQGAFAVGGTDIEMATDETWTAVAPGLVRQLGFSTDDVDAAYQGALASGLEVEGPPVDWQPVPSILHRAFGLRDPDGTRIQISRPA